VIHYANTGSFKVKVKSDIPVPTKPVLGMILKGYPRISETFISNEILLLEKLGFNIHIFSMRQPRDNFAHGSVKQIRAGVDYLPETLLVPLPRFLYYNLLLVLRKPRTYATALKMAFKRFRRTRRLATFKHLLQAGYLVQRFLPGKNVVHLHAHFAHSPTSVALFTSQLSGLKFSFTAHAKDIYTSDHRQLREKLCLAKFAVTCTETNRKYLEAASDGDASLVHRIYHGIDIDLFSGNPAVVKNNDEYHILTVARIIAKKGLPTVLHAIRRLCDSGYRIRHTLIGDGDQRAKILALIRKLALENTTRWLGTQPHETVLDYYRKADLFVLGCEVAPDGDRDGIPNVLLESMAMGVPVVATTVSAIPELVEDGSSGLLVPPGDPEKLAAAMERMLTSMSLRQQVIEKGRNRVIQYFDNKKLIKDLATVFRQQIPEFKNLIKSED
jgi:glycosyltransferase involved in cell wall biosynthesis